MSTMWKCEVCGYVHQGNAPPEVCPVCGVGPELFTAMQIDDGPSESAEVSSWRCTVCDYVHDGTEPPEVCPVCGVGSDMFEPIQAPKPAATEQADAKQLVIVGAGIAGLTAAEQARALAPDATITIISKEPGLPYYRLNLSRFLAEEVSDKELLIKPAEWFEENRIELCEAEVARIDRQNKQLVLRDGSTRQYERLILANGAHPFIPPISGVTREGVLSFRTTTDVRAINALASSNNGCICLGGGLLGLETAGALARRGFKVTVLEGFGWLLPRQLPRKAGDLLQAHIEKLGIQVRCDVKVKEIIGDERVAGVRLHDGEEIEGELVVITTGVRPNSHLARQCGLQTGAGVIVDDQMRTSDPEIFAAGDVTEHGGIVYGIWPTSFAQGMVAGRNSVGGTSRFSTIPPSNSLKVLDVDMISVGQVQPDDGSYEVIEQQHDQIYRRFVCRDGRLVGAVLYGDTNGANAVRDAIEQQTQLLALPELLQRFSVLAETIKRTAT